ncbi:branched-chain amino acid ABC transporter permease [Desulfosoma caldarium]|uniref:Amino acid/amide ABC transporter membrane protein 2 (HAAT family) n=1 Tax=Desulfosoma caldarium TaxID=610254 RepID=A0A3N1UM38_9BACT|nr:branched-chain amino acid ABC transporter permease [Desulfosoma caldarium]ROQ91143.1 amino acid/amide ABC transporter membrane protein 2 (HAAT family) [Desulfosoma caldarium]
MERRFLLGMPVALGLALLLSLFPLIVPIYWVMLATEILIMGLFAMSFNLLFGYAGLLSFGHGGFLGVGAYVTALFLIHGSWSLWFILLASILSASLAAFLVGFLCVRRDEIFFAMLSLALGMMLFAVAHNWREVTGGSDGLPVFAVPPLSLGLWKLSLFAPSSMYYFTLFWFATSALFLWTVVRSPFGLMLQAVRENKLRLSFSGTDVRLVRLAAFVIAGGLAGLAGFLLCLFNRMAAPDMLHWSFSARPVLMTILGGAGTFWGPAVGSAIFFILEHWVTAFTENWMIVLGSLLILVVLFFPDGIWGTLSKATGERKEQV